MSAEDYNERERAAGRLHPRHVAELARRFQTAAGLAVDGKVGPHTRALLDAALAAPAAPGQLAATVAWARGEALAWPRLSPAEREDRIRAYFADERRHDNWCAAFVATALEAASVPVPRSGAERRGAQALTRWCAGHGRWLHKPLDAPPQAAPELLPGDVVCWRRGTETWQGHVAIITETSPGGITIAEGNAQGAARERFVAWPAWANLHSGLYGIARPV